MIEPRHTTERGRRAQDGYFPAWTPDTEPTLLECGHSTADGYKLLSRGVKGTRWYWCPEHRRHYRKAAA